MQFLSKIEAFYLSILRVVILAAATLALVVVVIGVVRAVPAFTQQVLPPKPHEVAGANLGEFISEQRASGAETATIAAEEPAEAKADTPANITEAANALAAYLKAKLGLNGDPNKIAAILVENRNSLPAAYQDAYGDGVRDLMRQLGRSKGQPLPTDSITKLIQWHFDKFKAEAEADVSRRAADSATGLQSIIAAGVALLAFLLVVFCFIFVKIERNLRPVRTLEQSQKPVSGSIDPAPTVIV
jgi:hypothetical protein